MSGQQHGGAPVRRAHPAVEYHLLSVHPSVLPVIWQHVILLPYDAARDVTVRRGTDAAATRLARAHTVRVRPAELTSPRPARQEEELRDVTGLTVARELRVPSHCAVQRARASVRAVTEAAALRRLVTQAAATARATRRTRQCTGGDDQTRVESAKIFREVLRCLAQVHYPDGEPKKDGQLHFCAVSVQRWAISRLSIECSL